MEKNKFSFHSRKASFRFALKGVRIFFLTQPNAWIHLVAAVFAISFGLFFRITSSEWLFIILSVSMVFLAEMVNTAIEFIIDLVSPEYHPLAGKIKDMAAGAVLIASIFSVITGIIIFCPYFYGL